MSRMNRMKIFIEDYKSLDPYLKILTKEAHHHYQQELVQEYIKVSSHPYPSEYLHP
jgi:hypothetical protein